MKGTPITPIQYLEDARFQLPVVPTFSVTHSVLSILSLLVMAGLNVFMALQLRGLATWTWLPFVFTVFGATLGLVFESYLLMAGTPYQQTRTPATTLIRKLRLLNIAPVMTTVFYFVTCMVVRDPALRLLLLYVAVALGSALALTLFFGGAEVATGLTLMGLQLVQVVIVLASALPVGGWAVTGLLVAQAVLQLAAFRAGTSTPWKSTVFHVISTLSGLALYLAIMRTTSLSPDFSERVAASLPFASVPFWGFVAAAVAGTWLTMRTFPRTYNAWRTSLSYAIWSAIYFRSLSNPRFPKPFNLSSLYKTRGAPEPTQVIPYSQQHPNFMPTALAIPAVVNLEANVLAFTDKVKQLTEGFRLIELLDQLIPWADTETPLAEKPRMEAWSDGSRYWPSIFSKTIRGRTLAVPHLEPTPAPAIAAFKAGQLLAYYAESGVASPLLTPAPGREPGTLVLDLRFLEKYETKKDYEPYGGLAYFRVDSEKQRLELLSVVAPRETAELAPDPRDPVFRRAEAMVLASMYFQVITAKHLVEIHMAHNLVEVALHNAFEAHGCWNHPFRTFMYVHLFSHELVEELTTGHLVQDKAVFAQVFATTHGSLILHLNEAFRRFVYAPDEDFEARLAMMTMQNGGLLPHACIKWEMRYVALWERYATSLIDCIYANDAAVQDDACIRRFHAELEHLLVNKLPARYEGLRTKAGLARFASDTIHHLVIRHQVYGTTGAKAVLDQRINKTQVPRDGGPSAVDEWRSLACVGSATAHARFSLLMEDYNHLLEGVDDAYQGHMRAAFLRLQEDLKALDAEWTATDADRVFSYDYFRALPSDLRTGPGY